MLMALPEAGRAVDVVAVGTGRVVCGEALTAAASRVYICGTGTLGKVVPRQSRHAPSAADLCLAFRRWRGYGGTHDSCVHRFI